MFNLVPCFVSRINFSTSMITRMSVFKAVILITLVANYRHHFFLLAAFDTASISKYLNITN